MYCKHHTRGIVIGSKIEGDSNRRVSIFTENFGLVSARVQGARNTYSKLRGGSQDFSLSEFSLIHGKVGFRVVSVRALQNFYETFRNSPAKLKIAGNVLNLIQKLVAEEEAQTALFGVVVNFFNFLTFAKEEEIVLAECLTMLRILHILGYMRHDPELSVPISSTEITTEARMIALINESLRAT
jgi:DNA repair protein RecO